MALVLVARSLIWLPRGRGGVMALVVDTSGLTGCLSQLFHYLVQGTAFLRPEPYFSQKKTVNLSCPVWRYSLDLLFFVRVEATLQHLRTAGCVVLATVCEPSNPSLPFSLWYPMCSLVAVLAVTWCPWPVRWCHIALAFIAWISNISNILPTYHLTV